MPLMAVVRDDSMFDKYFQFDVPKQIKFLITIFALFLLTGCFNVSEDIWINSDQTARLVADVSISDKIVSFTESMGEFAKKDQSFNQQNSFIFGALKTFLDNNQNVKKSSIQEYSESGFRHYVVDTLIKDFHLLPQFSQQLILALDTNQGDIDNVSLDGSLFSFQDVNRKTVKFTQFFETVLNNPDFKQAFPEKEGDSNAIGKAFFSLILGDQYVTINLHAKKIGETNGRVSQDGTTVKWNFPITKLTEQNDLIADFSYR